MVEARLDFSEDSPLLGHLNRFEVTTGSFIVVPFDKRLDAQEDCYWRERDGGQAEDDAEENQDTSSAIILCHLSISISDRK